MTSISQRKSTPKFELFAFFFLAFGFSWSFWITAALVDASQASTTGKILLYAGIPGPSVAAFLLLYIYGRPAERQDLWRRIYEVERLRPRWLAAVVLLYPALTALAVAIDWSLGGSLPDVGTLTSLFRDPVLLLGSIGFVFLFGPLPEEPGWRGYALDRLLLLRGALGASIIIGILWAIWHLPAFFVPDTYQSGIGMGTLAFWLFCLTAVLSSIVMTWVCLHNDGSVFSAMLFHVAINFTRGMVPVSDRTELIRTSLLGLLAVVIALRLNSERPWGLRQG